MGSEMCIRDRSTHNITTGAGLHVFAATVGVWTDLFLVAHFLIAKLSALTDCFRSARARGCVSPGRERSKGANVQFCTEGLVSKQQAVYIAQLAIAICRLARPFLAVLCRVRAESSRIAASAHETAGNGFVVAEHTTAVCVGLNKGFSRGARVVLFRTVLPSAARIVSTAAVC